MPMLENRCPARRLHSAPLHLFCRRGALPIPPSGNDSKFPAKMAWIVRSFHLGDADCWRNQAWVLKKGCSEALLVLCK